MKKILEGLAALANEADAQGNMRLANQIDDLIKNAQNVDTKEFAFKVREFMKMNEADKAAFKIQNPDFERQMAMAGDLDVAEATSLGDRVHIPPSTRPIEKQTEVEKMHERARLVMQETVQMFKDAGEQVPMAVPTGKVTGKQILEFLKLAGQGTPLTGWHDLMKRLNNIKAQAAAHFAVGTPSPFGSAVPAAEAVPEDAEIERRDGGGQVAAIPTPTAGSGSASLSTGTKGPPVPPALK
jgi:hypothetical protein